MRYVLTPLAEYANVAIVEGGCRGADLIAAKIAIELGITVHERPANWKKYGRRAGAIRNREMFDEFQPRSVLAFHDNIEQSKGTKDMIAYAKKNDCPVRLVTS